MKYYDFNRQKYVRSQRFYLTGVFQLATDDVSILIIPRTGADPSPNTVLHYRHSSSLVLVTERAIL